MSEIYLSQEIDEFRTLMVSELSKDVVEDQSDEVSSSSGLGLFLYVLDDRPIRGGITVLAKVSSPDAALELFDLFFALSAINQSADKSNACQLPLQVPA